MYGKVSLSIAGGWHRRKEYIFSTDLANLKVDDIVLVEGPEGKPAMFAIFLGYIDSKELREGEGLKKIIRKAHGNTIKSFLKSRQDNRFGKYQLGEGVLQQAKEMFPQLQDKSEREIQKFVTDRLVLSPAAYNSDHKVNIYYYYDKVLWVQKNTVVRILKNLTNVPVRNLQGLERFLP